MADEPKPLKEQLTAEQQPLFDAALKQAAESAVTTFKTESEETRKKSIPEKYEFKFKNDSPLDSKSDAEKIATFAKAQGLTAEQAQAYLAHHEEIAGGVVQRQKEFLNGQIEKWKTDVESDKEIGGANLPQTQVNIKRAMDKFAPEGSAFRKLVNESGYGNHPEFVRVFNAIGQAMAEDSGTGSGGGFGKPKPKEDWEIAYGAKS